MLYSPKVIQRVGLLVKRRLGMMQKGDKSAEDDFMEQCISNMEDNGVDDAEDACAAIWEEVGEGD